MFTYSICMWASIMSEKAKGHTSHDVWGKCLFYFMLLLLLDHRQIHLDISEQNREKAREGK